MATFGALKTRIIAETNRDDLADDYAQNLTDAVNEAITHYSAHRFWFNQKRATSPTAIGVDSAVIPSGYRIIDSIWVPIGAGYELKQRTLDEIEGLSRVGGSGQPTVFAYYAPSGVAAIRMYPTPNAVLALAFIGVADEPALAVTGDSNAWTIYAEDLIAGRAKKTLCRDLFRDREKAADGKAAEDEAFARLALETANRVGTGRLAPSW